MNNLRNFFPRSVYFCGCLQTNIDNCLKPCSLQDICNEISQSDSDTMIYCVKCGEEKLDVVFSCYEHLTMDFFTVELHSNNLTVIEPSKRKHCLSCIKKFLEEKYYKYNCANFSN